MELVRPTEVGHMVVNSDDPRFQRFVIDAVIPPWPSVGSARLLPVPPAGV